jgi:16S rRNA G966 N2-methylase RsmD
MDNLTVVRHNVFEFLEICREKFDLIFADPPYALTRLAELPDLVLDRGLLSADGLFILEHGKDHNFAHHSHFIQERVYGSVHFSFFGANASDAAPSAPEE